MPHIFEEKKTLYVYWSVVIFPLYSLKYFCFFVGNLADLEEISPSNKNGITCEGLLQEAISSGKTYYNDCHVYPYTYYAGYLFRNSQYKKALEKWAEATDVIRK